MENKDFFDEEYDKIESQKAAEQAESFNSWYAQQPVQSKQSKTHKPLYIIIICVALVLCIAFGWALCAIFGGGRSREEQLLSEVLSVLDNNYYKEVDDASMWQGVEDAGTALLQSAGDRYSRLLSPASHYSLRNPQSSIGGNNGGVFGMSFQPLEGIGLYVYTVTVNSNAYGALQTGDIIVKMSNINDGQGATIDNVNYIELELNKLSTELIQEILTKVNSADFSILRDGAIVQKYIERGVLSYVNSDYPFEFIEFYFNDKFSNVSLTHSDKGPQTSVKEDRLLQRLAEIPDAGYIRIDQFMDTETDNGETNASDEFAKIMDLFKSEIKDENGEVIKKPLKYLILDLKGNPGGSVQYVSEIAGMLITDSKLSESDQRKMRVKSNEVLITTLVTRSMGSQQYSAKPKYEQYFGQLNDYPNIVVWTDGGSASASELLTGALLDYGTAVQMGVKTYGKGIAQTIKDLKEYKGTFLVNGEKVTYWWAIYYTVAEYFSPVTDTNIQDVGYVPKGSYNGLDTYDKLWTATANYFKTVSNGTGGGVLA